MTHPCTESWLTTLFFVAPDRPEALDSEVVDRDVARVLGERVEIAMLAVDDRPECPKGARRRSSESPGTTPTDRGCESPLTARTSYGRRAAVPRPEGSPLADHHGTARRGRRAGEERAMSADPQGWRRRPWSADGGQEAGGNPR